MTTKISTEVSNDAFLKKNYPSSFFCKEVVLSPNGDECLGPESGASRFKLPAAADVGQRAL